MRAGAFHEPCAGEANEASRDGQRRDALMQDDHAQDHGDHGDEERGAGSASGFLAAGKQASVAKPMQIRTKQTPFGPIAFKPSAMKRNEAPQMRPGRMSNSQPLVKTA